MYKYTGTEKIKSQSLKWLIRGVLGHAPTITLMICFCTVNISPLLNELPPKIIPYFIKCECLWNKFESGKVADVEHWPNCITCST